ncbi:unnamed protein product [Caenorhabditis sp. 36 PRJEB53466]|nr:unnamed protein product [Caenorhabditis sp. 36 PRJEB53466]
MSKNQSVQDFDENFFSSIAVPKTKDYSRLSSSPSRDQPCDSSYFEKHFPNLECDTPVKMRLPTAIRDSGDRLPTLCMDNFLSSSSASENTTVSGDQPTESTGEKQPQREPLKIAPNEKAKETVSNDYPENQLAEKLEMLTMFAPKAPEERLSQRRRSELKKKQEEESKRRSAVTVTSGTAPSFGRSRSISTKRAPSQEPVGRAPSVPRAPSATRSRHNSVSRTISAPNAAAAHTPGVVTRSMARAAEAASTTKQPVGVRRSVMPLKIAQKTPVSSVVKESMTGGDRSRDRTRRTNTTGAGSGVERRSFMKPSAGATTPVAPPRRSASANKTIASATKTTPRGRLIATANRSSTLRMSAVKPTAPPSAHADSKLEAPRPAAQATGGVRNRVPLRVNPTTPRLATKKVVAPLATRQPPVVTRARSVERGSQNQPSAASGTHRQPNGTRDDFFSRLSKPKAATPSRPSHDGPSSANRKSAVRPVPSYVHNVTKNG